VVYGISAWGLKLDQGTKQENLIITDGSEPEITVDNIEVAQFVYLLLHNQKIRNVIDTITSKSVLILGRFTDDRKKVLDALREELRKRDYLPILFDFDVPATRDITETVSLLARMARFIIADLTDPSSIPKELEAIVPSLAVPVQPLLEGASRPYAMFKDLLEVRMGASCLQIRGIGRVAHNHRGERDRPYGRKGESVARTAPPDRGGIDQASIGHCRRSERCLIKFASSCEPTGQAPRASRAMR
jgi:hypothetical protein